MLCFHWVVQAGSICEGFVSPRYVLLPHTAPNQGNSLPSVSTRSHAAAAATQLRSVKSQNQAERETLPSFRSRHCRIESAALFEQKNHVKQGWEDVRIIPSDVLNHFQEIAAKAFSRIFIFDVCLITILLLAQLVSPSFSANMVEVLEVSFKALSIPASHGRRSGADIICPLQLQRALALSVCLVKGFIAFRIPVELAKQLAISGRLEASHDKIR